MEENQSRSDLQMDPGAAAQLNVMAQWARFLGIAAVAGTVLFLLAILFLWTRLSGQLLPEAAGDDDQTNFIMKVFVVAVFVIAGVIITVLMSFLIKGATRVRNGIRNNDQQLFNSGLANIRNYFAMYAVLSIIGLVFSLVSQFIRQ